ncbi:MAG: hypothetical protein FWF15_04230 [Oscillospiraceae bacterium]|nr:hypothetical protein [Oscillospiraceae bacterium]
MKKLLIFVLLIILMSACTISNDIAETSDAESESTSKEIIEEEIESIPEEPKNIYTYTSGLTETQDWNSYSWNSDEKITYTFILPDGFYLDSSVIYKDDVKVGELAPPAKLMENQQMPTSLEDCKRIEFDGYVNEYYDSENILLDGYKIFLTREISHPWGGDITTWYPHRFYILKDDIDDIVFTITFYPLVEYPDAELFDAYLKTVTSIEIVE